MTVERMGQVQIAPIDTITPSADNPRRINDAAINIVAKSLTRFGWQQPIVIDPNRVIVAGHTRHLAAKKLGLPSVPIVVADLSPDEIKAYRIADNRTNDFTQWDFPELVQQLEELSPDFSEELALADWDAIAYDFEQTLDTLSQQEENTRPGGEQPAEQGGASDGMTTTSTPENGDAAKPQDVEVSDAVLAQVSTEHTLTVICETKEAAANVQAAIIDLEGVIDVRNKR